jgi:putative redox protein
MKTIESHFGGGKINQKIQVGGIQIFSDHDADADGDGTGASPLEFLGIALAACTGMTLRMYTLKKEWPLEDAVVKVDAQRIDELEILNRSIQLVGNLSQEQKERLLEIANKCYLHKVLTGKIQVKTQLV